MKSKFTTLSFLFLLSFVFIASGCKNGTVKKASGGYTAVVVNPQGGSSAGTATVNNSGNLFTIAIDSRTGDFAFSGTMSNNQVRSTFIHSDGQSATAVIQFSNDRNSFSGNLQTSTGTFVIHATRILA